MIVLLHEIAIDINSGKGKEQYEYLIDFKKNGTSDISNTVYKDLLRAHPMSQNNDTISNNKSQEEKSDKMHFRVTAEVDRECLELAKNPEKNEARLIELVDAAAKEAMPYSKMLTSDGKLCTFYHGTHTTDFNVFKKEYISSSSGDTVVVPMRIDASEIWVCTIMSILCLMYTIRIMNRIYQVWEIYCTQKRKKM